MKKMILAVLVMLQLLGCSIAVESKEDVYVAKMSEILDSFEIVARNWSVDKSNPNEAIINHRDKATALQKQLEKLSPPEKLKKDHEQLLTMFTHYVKSMQHFYDYQVKKDVKDDIGYDDESRLWLNVWNNNPLTKEPYHKRSQ